ncbi:hypothetical protein GCM10010339_76200 [Streptomyces alanosinicus]|uniref:Uncharacterized protein n=1 Tax=Streptomyces alanosinicus TaxID=68171 RepID=A0A919D788_9ACTN|nr:hypothetical protein GCM10010339_76200 [Streptomyces alanosinicus]
MLCIFDGGMLSPEEQGDIRLQASEIARYGFHQASAIPGLTIPRLARRICATAAARAEGLTAPWSTAAKQDRFRPHVAARTDPAHELDAQSIS